jgi:hypothetical protein
MIWRTFHQSNLEENFAPQIFSINENIEGKIMDCRIYG